MTPKPTIRCAVYTRKSTDEGLDQEFNSLDAQREAGEAYITSQKAEGWVCVPEHYDDGGFTGGNMERPALHRLLADIEAGKIDCVVVYKVDRLSRSLLDFARVMAVFDERKIAFCAVTQQFNTSTPMGRLVLNVLLSFAQFEREIIGERIRDKLAAQCRRGKWTGGAPVLGYDVDRSERSPKLVVNSQEAARVRAIFELYEKVGSLLLVVDELEERGWKTKVWVTKSGKNRGDVPFDRGNLYGLLKNPIYIGKIKHKKNLYDGEHEAIVDCDLFHRVQKQMQLNGRTGGSAVRNRYGYLLRGLLQCKACGHTMVHTFTSRGDNRYRYYKCTKAIKSGQARCPSRPLPANEIERIVVDQIRGIADDAALRDEVYRQTQEHVQARIAELKTERKQLRQEQTRLQHELVKISGEGVATAEAVLRMAELQEAATSIENRLAEVKQEIETAATDKIDRNALDQAFSDFDNIWSPLSPREQSQVLALLIAKVEYDSSASTIATTFHPTGIQSLTQSEIAS